MWTLAAGAVTPAEITVFLVSLAVLLGAARGLGEMARKLGQPTVLGEILAGVLLGPTVLGAVSPDLYTWLFPEYLTGMAAVVGGEGGGAVSPVKIGLDLLLMLSVCLLLLVAGLEVDLSSVARQGKAAAAVSIAGIAVPFSLGFGICWVLPGLMGMEPGADKLPFALFVGIAMSITALPVIAKVLMDLNMLKTDLGMLVMSSAMVNDLLGWLGFALVLAMIAGAGEGEAATAGAEMGLGMTIALTLVFVGGMLTVGRWLANRSLPWVQANTSFPGGPLTLVLIVALAGAAFTEWIGIHSIFGAFIVGIAVGDSRHLREKTRSTIEQFVTNFFAPLFFASIGLRVNFVDAFDPLLVIVVLVVAILGKLLGCFAGAKLAGMESRPAWAVGFGMSARGAMEIILGQLALEADLITPELFVAIVVMALATSLLPGPMMQWLMGRKQVRGLADLTTDKTFIPRLKARDVREALEELAEVAARELDVDPARIVASAWRREQVMPTGLPQGIAVPHASVPGLKRPLAVVGISQPGIDFDARDGSQSHIICLLLAPADKPEAQVELLAAVSRALATDAARDEIGHAQTAVEFRAALAATSDPPAAANHG